MIGGWAYQSNIPNTALTVHIYIINNSTGEQKIIGVTAGGYRADLAAAGYGNGYHAFQYNINWKTYKPGTYTVRAYAIGVNSSNPQLDYSPKSYTVRNPAGNVEYVNLNGIGGWAWKPDAPNSAIDVHIYIYKYDNTQVAFYAVTASQPRSDLASAGYGNGNHGFSKTIDWSALPEERLRVVVYAVDGSGYNPSFYSGYYDNRRVINLLGVVDWKGVDYSAWATPEHINYCYNIGTPQVNSYYGANQAGVLEIIREASYCAIYTHGTPTSIYWCFNPYSDDKSSDWLEISVLKNINSSFFAGTRCLLLVACETGKGENTQENMVNQFQKMGIETVVGFENIVIRFYNTASKKILTTAGDGLWAVTFNKCLGEGKTVTNAAREASQTVVNEHGIEKAEEYGLLFEQCYIAGNAQQIVKH